MRMVKSLLKQTTPFKFALPHSLIHRRRQASKKFYNKCSENSRSQIVFRTDIFGKLTLGAPDYRYSMLEKCFAVFERIWYPFERLGVSVPKKLSSIRTAWAICLEKIVVHLNGLGYLFGKNCRPFEQLGLSVSKKKINIIHSNGLGYPFQKIVIHVFLQDARAMRLKKNLSTVGGTEPICSKINFSRISIPKPFHLQPLVSNDVLFSRSRMLRSLFTNLS